MASRMITPIVIAAIVPSFAIAYGKNGFPWFFRIEYSRRYCSRSRAFIRLDLLAQEALLLGLEPRRGGGAELHDEIEVCADQRDDQPRDREHVKGIEACDGGRPEFGARPQEVSQVGADDGPGGVDVHGDHRRPEGALVEREQVA